MKLYHCREIEGEHADQNICNNIKNMLCNWNTTLDHVFFARNCKKQNKKHKQNALLIVQ